MTTETLNERGEAPTDEAGGFFYERGVEDAKAAILDLITTAQGEDGRITPVGVDVLRMEIAELTAAKLAVEEK